MVTRDEQLEARLREIGRRSGRTVQQVADDVLSDYADEMDALEAAHGTNVEAPAEEFVYVRRRRESQDKN